ncbi:MAG: flagellar basal body P-ring formation chaperone FlgA [Planctomycetota bacterium]|jgi:flagella basal body P-ring formation protein FlgA
MMKMNHLQALLVAVGLSLVLSGALQAGLVLTLKEKATVAGSYIRLADVAGIEGEEGADLARVALGRSPALGDRSRVNRWQIKAQLRAWGVGESGLRFEGAESVQVARVESRSIAPVAPVSAPEMEEAEVPAAPVRPKVAPRKSDRALLEGAVAEVIRKSVVQTLNVSGARVAVELKSLGEVKLPLDSIAGLKVENPPLSYRATSQTFRISLYGSDQHRLTTVKARANLTVALPVVVAKTEIPRNAMILKEALTIRYAEKVSPEEVFFQTRQLIGQTAKSGMRPGTVIRRSAVQVPPLVERGQIMAIKAKVGAFTITSMAQVQQSGKAGQVIRVRNVDSGKLYSALVTESGDLKLILQ